MAEDLDVEIRLLDVPLSVERLDRLLAFQGELRLSAKPVVDRAGFRVEVHATRFGMLGVLSRSDELVAELVDAGRPVTIELADVDPRRRAVIVDVYADGDDVAAARAIVRARRRQGLAERRAQAEERAARKAARRGRLQREFRENSERLHRGAFATAHNLAMVGILIAVGIARAARAYWRKLLDFTAR